MQYGDPSADFRRTAAYWNTHLAGVLDRKIAAWAEEHPERYISGDEVREIVADLVDIWDVALMMDLLKTSRLAWSPHKGDSWADKAGYSACGYECSLDNGADDWAAGELVKDLPAPADPVPTVTHRGYRYPSFHEGQGLNRPEGVE